MAALRPSLHLRSKLIYSSFALNVRPGQRNLTLSSRADKFLVEFSTLPSTVGGRGNFAVRPVSAGTKVWTFDPDTCSRFYPDTLHKVQPAVLKEIIWASYLTKDLKKMIVLEDGAQFTNHGLPANIKFGEDDETWVAATDIKAGEEMVIDYGTFGDNIDADWVRPLAEKYCQRALEFEKIRRGIS